MVINLWFFFLLCLVYKQITKDRDRHGNFVKVKLELQQKKQRNEDKVAALQLSVMFYVSKIKKKFIWICKRGNHPALYTVSYLFYFAMRKFTHTIPDK